MCEHYSEKLIALVEKDETRVKALDCVHSLNLPQCYIAAGFVRNLVWDSLHNKRTPTPLNDIDVIYYEPEHLDDASDAEHERQLEGMMPDLNWQVKNQAYIHTRNNDRQYQSTLDAMSYWPEKETAVAIRKNNTGGYDCIAAFGFESLFSLELTHNPKRCFATFEQRVINKAWLEHWPLLIVASPAT